MTFVRLVYSVLPFKRWLGQFLARGLIDKPVVLVGCGRSGTTALLRAIGKHTSVVASPYEAPLIAHLGEIAFEYQFGEIQNYFRESTQIPSCELIEALRRLAFEAAWGSNWGLHVRICSWNRFTNARLWAVKAFPDERQAQGLGHIFPEAKFIYIFRNGLDVVNSMGKFGWFSRQTFSARCQFWAERVSRYAYLQQDPTAISVRYEEFLSSTDVVLRMIFEHLNLAYDFAPLEYSRSTVVHPLNKPTQRGDPRQILLNREPAYASWSAEEKSIFKDICADAMGRLEYEIPF